MNKTILVVEDEPLLLEAIGKKMEIEQLPAHLCSTGDEALAYLASAKQIPAAIWLDYHLTDMDGLTFMSQLQKNEHWKDIPVVVVSNTASDDKINAMLLLGAKKYIVKAENRLTDIIEMVRDISLQSTP
jgi:two-component system response regulator